MRSKILSVIAIAALVAACESAPDDSASAAGGGSTQPTETYTTPVGQAQVTPGSQQDLVQNVGDRVFFGFDKYDLNDEARSTLEAQAAWLKKFPNVTVSVEGHADERGTREYNLALGERRANSAKDYLVFLGIDPNRVTTVSYGEERPVALGSNDSAWAQNRRSVTVVRDAAGS